LRELSRIQDTEEKRLDTGESYQVVEAQSENKTEDRRLGTDLLTEFVQGAPNSGSVEDFVCYCSSNLFNVIDICRSAGDCPLNQFINPENPLIACCITRICDNSMNVAKLICSNPANTNNE
jgi:hypothetical protein